jgi:hypothetical protein
MLFGELLFRKSKCNRKQKIRQNYIYNEEKVNFQTDYDRINPVTRDRALDNWVKFIESIL